MTEQHCTVDHVHIGKLRTKRLGDRGVIIFLPVTFITISLINSHSYKKMFPCFATFPVFSQITPQFCVLCIFIRFIPLAAPLRDCDHQDENSARRVRGETFHLRTSTLHYTSRHLRKLYFSTNHVSSFLISI